MQSEWKIHAVHAWRSLFTIIHIIKWWYWYKRSDWLKIILYESIKHGKSHNARSENAGCSMKQIFTGRRYLRGFIAQSIFSPWIKPFLLTFLFWKLLIKYIASVLCKIATRIWLLKKLSLPIPGINVQFVSWHRSWQPKNLYIQNVMTEDI